MVFQDLRWYRYHDYRIKVSIRTQWGKDIIGNKYNELEETKAHWDYKALKTIDDALTGADFVVISILPGTFDEMESDEIDIPMLGYDMVEATFFEKRKEYFVTIADLLEHYKQITRWNSYFI